ncbi:MAG: ABC transporter ATP-binding protein [Synergistaceae bacterium]|jgi:ABC-type glutathione transport system ATPase component|nr:ABC transporter ATP-binding protein [Synergistaceae bacterium]
MNGESQPISLDIQDWSVTYTGWEKPVHAVKNCSLSVARGRIVGLVGESGSGKSTLLMSIPKLLPAGTVTSGRIYCAGGEISRLSEDKINLWRWRRIALVPQGAMNSFTPHLTIERHISEVLRRHLGIPKRDCAQRAAELAAMAGLEKDVLYRYPHELSGGQKQRAALSAALACEPDFLLADEPTTALDVITQKGVLDTIASLVRERGMGLLLVTHDLPLAATVSDSLAVMKDGKLVEQGPSGEVSRSPRHLYAQKLVAAIRDMEGQWE